MKRRKKLRRIRVLPDGNCLFRALAVHLAHKFVPSMVRCDDLNTLVAQWLRCYVVLFLAGDNDVNIGKKLPTTQGKHVSLYQLLLHLRKHPKHMQALKRFQPKLSVVRCRPRLKLPHTELSRAALLSDHTSPVDYVRRMLRSGAWGGENELFAAAHVMRMHVRTPISTYKYKTDAHVHVHTIRLHYNGVHYDALI
jgi:hypothetical protein